MDSCFALTARAACASVAKGSCRRGLVVSSGKHGQSAFFENKVKCVTAKDPRRSRHGKQRSVSVHCTMTENVLEQELDDVAQTKEDALKNAPRTATSTYLDKTGQTKLISVKDYMEWAPDFLKEDMGPPRWFCSTDARGSPDDAPTLLFIPGMDSLGLGLLLHQKKLARLFEVQCLHIPLHDRTCFTGGFISIGAADMWNDDRGIWANDLLGLMTASNITALGLVEIVEKRIRDVYDSKPSPVYLLGESFGGSIALAVAARNPSLDLVLVLVNPATSFMRSQLQPLLPVFKNLPDGLFRLTPFLLSFTFGNPVRMASASVDSNLPPWERIPKVANALTDLLPTLPVLADIVPSGSLIWRLKLLEDGARYTNPRLGNVKAEMFLLASGNDQILPSEDEARRLKKMFPDMKIRFFPDSGHTLLLEEGLDVAQTIKAVQGLRHKKNAKYDPVTDFRPPYPDEVEAQRKQSVGTLRQLYSPVFLTAEESAEDNGQLQVRSGLPQLPNGKPLLFVSNHTLIGFDLGLVVDEFIQKRSVLLRGLAHPKLGNDAEDLQRAGQQDSFRLFGSVPVSGASLYKILARGEAALLYPGGVREALKKKGELYKLFWSETTEFVRTAIRHGATIVPFASVGGDDIIQIALDRDEILAIPFLRDQAIQTTANVPRARSSGSGEVMNEDFIAPLGFPNIPPRVYFLFKQPISTEGMLSSIKDEVVTRELYLKVKSDVESGLDYLLQKREKDPYNNFFRRIIYEAVNDRQAPTFDY